MFNLHLEARHDYESAIDGHKGLLKSHQDLLTETGNDESESKLVKRTIPYLHQVALQ